MKSLPLPLLLLSLSVAVPACSKKKDKVPEAALKTAESSLPSADKGAAKNNAELDAVLTKAKALEERLDALDWKSAPFKKELVAALGPATATVKDDVTTEYWLTCDAERCVGASLQLDEDDVSQFDPLDENKDNYYYGYALLAWRTANANKVPSSKMKPSELEAVGATIENAESMKWDAALALVGPAGKSVKHLEGDDEYWHAVDGKTCTALSIFKLDDVEVDAPDMLTYDSAPDPLDNDAYARCAMHAMGL